MPFLRHSTKRLTSRTAHLWLGMVLLVTAALPLWSQSETSATTPAATAQTGNLASQVAPILEQLSEITGWKVKRHVPSEILTNAEFAEMVEEGLEEAELSDEARAADLTLKMFGLVPWDYNLVRESASLIEEQAAAFYDFDKKRLFVLESTPDGLQQRMALVHELAHALADQHHSLEKFLRQADSDDEATARQAVIEGQANWLSWAYMSYELRGIPEVPKLALDQLADAAGATGDEFPVFNQAPLYIRESLVFPYAHGMRFQDAVYRRMGPPAFEHIFDHPPRSTKQILNAKSYTEDEKPTKPGWPKLNRLIDPDEERALEKLAEGDVGLFDYSALLRQYLVSPSAGPEAGIAVRHPEEDLATAVGHLRGARYRLYEHESEWDPQRRPFLLQVSEWDSPQSAQTFLDLYAEVLEAKWDSIEIRSRRPGEITGSGDTGDFLLRIDGTHVVSLEGIRAAQLP